MGVAGDDSGVKGRSRHSVYDLLERHRERTVLLAGSEDRSFSALAVRADVVLEVCDGLRQGEVVSRAGRVELNLCINLARCYFTVWS